MSLGTNLVCQISIVVHSIDRISENYAKLFDLPIPTVIDVPSYEEVPIRFKGKPMDPSGCRLCVFSLDNIAIELIEPNMDIDTVWREHLLKNGQSVHHIGFVVDNHKRVLEELRVEGCIATMTGYMGHLTYSFLDCIESFGVNFNIKERNQNNQELIRFLIEHPLSSAEDTTTQCKNFERIVFLEVRR